MTDVKRLDRYVRFSVTPCFSLGRDKTLYFLLPLCYHLICTSVLIASDDRSRIQHNDDHVSAAGIGGFFIGSAAYFPAVCDALYRWR